MKIAILGGTGKLGLGFVARLARTSHSVAVGSRDAARAKQAVESFSSSEGLKNVQGMSNEEAAEWCDAAVLTVPYRAHRATLAPIAGSLVGKIVIDTTVPLDPDNFLQIKTESGKSAAEETSALIGNAAAREVYAAFQTISHRLLRRLEVREEVLLAGDSGRKSEVMQLIRDMNLKPIDAGPLEAAGLLERLTPLLLSINRQNKIKEAGVKITGIDD